MMRKARIILRIILKTDLHDAVLRVPVMGKSLGQPPSQSVPPVLWGMKHHRLVAVAMKTPRQSRLLPLIM
jgi:hypothetical protein